MILFNWNPNPIYLKQRLWWKVSILLGTLDGFTFDSDEEGDKLPEPHASQNDQNNEDGDQPKAKTKRKAEKPAGKGQKKAKVAGKATKKVTRKTQTTKRTKKAKK